MSEIQDAGLTIIVWLGSTISGISGALSSLTGAGPGGGFSWGPVPPVLLLLTTVVAEFCVWLIKACTAGLFAAVASTEGEFDTWTADAATEFAAAGDIAATEGLAIAETDEVAVAAAATGLAISTVGLLTMAMDLTAVAETDAARVGFDPVAARTAGKFTTAEAEEAKVAAAAGLVVASDSATFATTAAASAAESGSMFAKSSAAAASATANWI